MNYLFAHADASTYSREVIVGCAMFILGYLLPVVASKLSRRKE